MLLMLYVPYSSVLLLPHTLRVAVVHIGNLTYLMYVMT